MTTRPTPDQLRQWHAIYRQRAINAYVELIASYTPEQLALVARINEARKQERLCRDRMRPPRVVPLERLKWPEEPGEE